MIVYIILSLRINFMWELLAFNVKNSWLIPIMAGNTLILWDSTFCKSIFLVLVAKVNFSLQIS